MFFSLTFLFNIDILLKFIGMARITQMETVFLSQIGSLIPIIVGLLVYKEKLDLNKILGFLVITFGTLFGMSG